MASDDGQKRDKTGTGKKAQDKHLLTEEAHIAGYLEERNFLLRDIPYATARRAWFTLAHLLPEDGTHIADLGCGDGTLTYAMAAMNPNVHFTGTDKSKRNIDAAKSTYQLPNLSYLLGDVTDAIFDPESLDGIVNSFTLHEIFSESRYNARIVSDTLRRQFSMLKNNGTMFIRDYSKPAGDPFVLMEMHDKESHGDALADLSEADLLVWYAEHARPTQNPGCGGFFLEELPPRFPKTRLFRLPYKWAYEFIMRKDDRELWEKELPFEYTFFTADDFREELSALGAQVVYSAPHWDETHIRRHFEGHFRLMNSKGDILPDPPTSFIALARKKAEKSSLIVHERRISDDEDGMLEIKTLRDQKNGDIVDIVTRGMEFAEILPYRLDDTGRLYIYLHDNVIRGLTNAISRSGENIDEHIWSGHMLEAVSVEHRRLMDLGKITVRNTQSFIKSYFGLTAKSGALIEKGTSYYPDPNYIDERVNTYFVEVNPGKKTLKPKRKILKTHHFLEKGTLRELSAQNVLDAITVGLIPNARLELQILSLMQHIDVKAENWVRQELSIASGEITQSFEVREFLRQASYSDKRFREIKGSAGQLHTVNSIFVEEGQSQGGMTGLSSETLEFVLSEDKTINTAVCLPITKSARGDLHAGFTIKHMPIPQRYEGNGISLSAPQFNIPKEIKDHRALKQFIAEKFGVTPNMVLKMGESYFTHIGMTPHRIHPFAIAAPPDSFKDPDTKFIPMYQYMVLWQKLSKEQHFMSILARAYMRMPDHIKFEAKRKSLDVVKTIFQAAQPDWSLPVSIEQTEDKILRKPQKSKKEEPQDTPVDLVHDFENEIESLRKLAEEQKDKDSKPEPEEW